MSQKKFRLVPRPRENRLSTNVLRRQTFRIQNREYHGPQFQKIQDFFQGSLFAFPDKLCYCRKKNLAMKISCLGPLKRAASLLLHTMFIFSVLMFHSSGNSEETFILHSFLGWQLQSLRTGRKVELRIIQYMLDQWPMSYFAWLDFEPLFLSGTCIVKTVGMLQHTVFQSMHDHLSYIRRDGLFLCSFYFSQKLSYSVWVNTSPDCMDTSDFKPFQGLSLPSTPTHTHPSCHCVLYTLYEGTENAQQNSCPQRRGASLN